MIPHASRPNTIKLALFANINSIAKDDAFVIPRKVNCSSLLHQEEGENQNHGAFVPLVLKSIQL